MVNQNDEIKRNKKNKHISDHFDCHNFDMSISTLSHDLVCHNFLCHAYELACNFP